MKQWETIADVPLNALFRFKKNPNEVFRIHQINLQYGGVPMPGLALKAGPAVMIKNQWWRLTELKNIFEASLDAEHWVACEGEILGGDVDRMAASFDRALQGARQLSEATAESLGKLLTTMQTQIDRTTALEKQVGDVLNQLSALKAKDVVAPTNPAPGPVDKTKKS